MISSKSTPEIQPNYEAVGCFYRDRAPVKTGGKWQLIDAVGRVVGSADAEDFSRALALDGIIAARLGGKWGFMDFTGRWVIRRAFSSVAWGFLDGVAQVRSEEGIGWIDRTGQWVFKPELEPRRPIAAAVTYSYDSTNDRDVLPILQGGKWGLVSRQGRTILSPQYESIQPFSERLAIVRSKGKMGAIDLQGRIVLPLEFQSLLLFREGVSPACREALKCGFIDRDGRWVIQPIYKRATYFSDGLAKVMTQDDQNWFIDHQGRQVVDGARTHAFFSEGRIGGSDEAGKYGFKDKAGSWLIQPQYEAVGCFYRSRAPVKTGGRWHFIDLSGRVVASTDAENFVPTLSHDSLIRAMRGGKWGFMDFAGRGWPIQPAYDVVQSGFLDGLAMVRVSEGIGWIDRTGQWVIKPSQ